MTAVPNHFSDPPTALSDHPRYPNITHHVPNVLPVPSFYLGLALLEPFPGQIRYKSPAASSGSTLGSRPSWTCAEKLQREAARRYPYQMPTF